MEWSRVPRPRPLERIRTRRQNSRCVCSATFDGSVCAMRTVDLCCTNPFHLVVASKLVRVCRRCPSSVMQRMLLKPPITLVITVACFGWCVEQNVRRRRVLESLKGAGDLHTCIHTCNRPRTALQAPQHMQWHAIHLSRLTHPGRAR